MVANSKAQMNQFFYGVSDLVKTECRNAMLLGMNISRLMTHAQQVKGDKLREHAKDNKKARTRNYVYSQQKSCGEYRSQSQQRFSSPTPSSSSVPSSKNKYDVRAPGSKSQGSVSGNKTYMLYAFQARQDQEGSSDVVTRMS